MRNQIKTILKWLSLIWMKCRYPYIKFIFNEGVSCKNVKICKNKGGGNSATIETGASLQNVTIKYYGLNNKVIIHKNAKIQNVTFWFEGDNNLIEIGAKTTFHGICQLAACDGTKIEIGEDCMFSHDIYVRTTDSHSILDMYGNRINQEKDIIIGNHVWVGMQSLILKGSTIPDGCIVGARSIITSKIIPTNSIIVGSPAKVVKKNINWCFERL